MKRFPFTVPSVAIVAMLVIPACQRSTARKAEKPDSLAVARADSITVRDLVVTFGSRLKQVPLAAPDTTLARMMLAQYSGVVAEPLIRQWASHPKTAPGRLTSSPWPDRIEIASQSRKSARVFLVDGEIVERTSADAAGESGRIPVRLTVWKTGRKWHITRYDQGPPRTAGTPAAADDDPDLTPDRAAAVVRAYYDAIGAKKYREAYQLWEADGAASGQSLVEFVNGYAQTQSVHADVGAPGAIGAAAGSRYVDVPVRITAVNQRGGRESFAGTYTLRRSVVDGATPKQRTWRIYSANIRKVGTA